MVLCIDQLINPCDPSYLHYEWVLQDDGTLSYIAKMEEQTVQPAVMIEYRLTVNTDGSGNINTYLDENNIILPVG